MVVMEEEVRDVDYMVRNFTSGIFCLQYSMGGRINDVATHQVEFLEAIFEHEKYSIRTRFRWGKNVSEHRQKGKFS